MAPIKIEAIVLKRINFRETSVILSLYTEQMGKIKCLLKGARTEKSRIPPLAFTPGSSIFGFLYMRRSELGLLSSPSLIESYSIERKANLAAWHIILNLVNIFTPEKEKEKELFHLLSETGKMLSYSETPLIIFVGFKIKLVKILGYGIELNRCIICEELNGQYLFSGKRGGTVCHECGKKETASIKISNSVLSIARQMEKMDFKKMDVIKKVPQEILQKINFYINVTMNYHAGIDGIWWENEKNIIFGNN